LSESGRRDAAGAAGQLERERGGEREREPPTLGRSGSHTLGSKDPAEEEARTAEEAPSALPRSLSHPLEQLSHPPHPAPGARRREPGERDSERERERERESKAAVPLVQEAVQAQGWVRPSDAGCGRQQQSQGNTDESLAADARGDLVESAAPVLSHVLAGGWVYGMEAGSRACMVRERGARRCLDAVVDCQDESLWMD
jgi:hypothetical protein